MPIRLIHKTTHGSKPLEFEEFCRIRTKSGELWLEVDMNKHIGKVAVDRNFHKRRYRQIGRLLYYYCCVRYLTRENGQWVKAMSDGRWLGEQ